MRIAWLLSTGMAVGMYAPALGSAEPPATPIRVAEEVVVAPEPLPAVTDYSPAGRVELDEPLRVRFDRDVDRAAVEAGFRVTPATPGRFEWTSSRSFLWHPDRWRAGVEHSVRLDGTRRSHGWRFRTRVAPPRLLPRGAGGRVVLTFDDSPGLQSRADRFLRALRFMRVQAIFFPENVWAQQHPDWVARAEQDGHLVCNHTLDHRDLTSSALTEDEVRRQIVQGAGHGSCPLLRPPLGATDDRVQRIARELGYELYLWDVDSHDWEGWPAEDIAHHVLRRARPGSVVLFHLHAEATLQALPQIVRTLRRGGYELGHGMGPSAGDQPTEITAEFTR